jgi:hypothetical protein
MKAKIILGIALVFLLIVSLNAGFLRKLFPPEPEPEWTAFYPYRGVAGGHDELWNAGQEGLTAELNDTLNCEMIRWICNSRYVEGLGIEAYVAQLKTMQPEDVEVFLQLRWNSPGKCNPEPTARLQSSPPKQWSDWEDFCYDMAEATKDFIHFFQLGNEFDWPGQRYWTGTIPQAIEFVNRGAEAIHRANPKAVIACGGFTGGKEIGTTIQTIVDGLNEHIAILDRHFGLERLTPDEVRHYMFNWPVYVASKNRICMVGELWPPYFAEAKEAGIKIVLAFDLWGSGENQYGLANSATGMPTDIGRIVGSWIEEHPKIRKVPTGEETLGF